jgi:hypothetical protein
MCGVEAASAETECSLSRKNAREASGIGDRDVRGGATRSPSLEDKTLGRATVSQPPKRATVS